MSRMVTCFAIAILCYAPAIAQECCQGGATVFYDSAPVVQSCAAPAVALYEQPLVYQGYAVESPWIGSQVVYQQPIVTQSIVTQPFIGESIVWDSGAPLINDCFCGCPSAITTGTSQPTPVVADSSSEGGAPIAPVPDSSTKEETYSAAAEDAIEPAPVPEPDLEISSDSESNETAPSPKPDNDEAVDDLFGPGDA